MARARGDGRDGECAKSSDGGRMQCLDDFVEKFKNNPLTKAKIVVAKNISYAHERSEEAYTILLPLSVDDGFLPLSEAEKRLGVGDDAVGGSRAKKTRCYMYVLAVVDSETDLTEYRMCVGQIEDLTRFGNRRVFSFDSSKCSKPHFEKEITCVRELAMYFDPAHNSALYKAHKNSRMSLVPVSTVYDESESEQLSKSAGYYELRHQRVVVHQTTYSYVQILCCRTVGGVRRPATVSSVLHGEFRLVYAYLRFVEKYYKVRLHEAFALQKRYLENSRRDLIKTISKIEMFGKQQARKLEKRKKNNEDVRRSSFDREVFERSEKRRVVMESMYPDDGDDSDNDDECVDEDYEGDDNDVDCENGEELSSDDCESCCCEDYAR